MDNSFLRQYGLMLGALTAFIAVLLYVIASPMIVEAQEPRLLIHPVIALVSLTGVVWLLMFAYRNVAVIQGKANIGYYQTYTGATPPEWVERPARTFMNLLEVPVLFYVLVVLMLQTNAWDGTQVSLAWLFVAARVLHAAVYIGMNFVPLRLATYLMGCITLLVMWFRFATGFA